MSDELDFPPAVTPAQAAQPNDARTILQIRQAIEKVNETLKRSHQSGVKTTIAADIIGSGKAGERVLQHFRQAGWKVDFKFDQREGDYYTFSA